MFLTLKTNFLFFVTFGTFGNEVTKILHNLCLHFARQDGQDRKKQKVTKKTRDQKTKIWDERNIRSRIGRRVKINHIQPSDFSTALALS